MEYNVSGSLTPSPINNTQAYHLSDGEEKREENDPRINNLRQTTLGESQHLDQSQSLERKIERLFSLRDFCVLSLLQPVASLLPIPVKYPYYNEVAGAGIKGADGVDDISNRHQHQWSSYARRYNGLTTAPEIFKVGFTYALNELLHMSENFQGRKKIMLNRSMATPMSVCRSYSHLSLDGLGLDSRSTN